MKKIRVMLVDEHVLLRTGLRTLVHAQSDMTIVAEDAGPGVAQKCGKLKPDVLVMNLTAKKTEGIQAIATVHKACPDTRVLVITTTDDPLYLQQILAADAAGCLSKTATDTALVTAIRAVAQGRAFVDMAIDKAGKEKGAKSKSRKSGPAGGPALPLSRREREVLEFVAHGFTNQQIARRLGLSVKSVESYRARLMEKLNLKSRAELVRYALEKGLLGIESPKL